jgi:exodeoxyribonuclease-3
MRIVTFNVNGIRSMSGKNKAGKPTGSEEEIGLCQLVKENEVDILCLQEIKTQSEGDLAFLRELLPYGDACYCSRKKGYSGVALLSTIQPEWISYGFDLFHEDRIGQYRDWEVEQEGRLICAMFSNCVVVTVYVPNAQPSLVRIDDRMRWDQLLRNYMNELRKEFGLPIVVCGDFNVAPEDRDIHRKQPKQTPGTSKEERDGFQGFMADSWLDAYRLLHPDGVGDYTYWSNFRNSREQNKGWRIDLFILSPDLRDKVTMVSVLSNYHGSDHGAVLLEWID